MTDIDVFTAGASVGRDKLIRKMYHYIIVVCKSCLQLLYIDKRYRLLSVY